MKLISTSSGNDAHNIRTEETSRELSTPWLRNSGHLLLPHGHGGEKTKSTERLNVLYEGWIGARVLWNWQSFCRPKDFNRERAIKRDFRSRGWLSSRMANMLRGEEDGED